MTHLNEIVRVSQIAFEQHNRRLLWAPLLAFAHALEREMRLQEAADVLKVALALSRGRDAESEEIGALLQLARVLRLDARFEQAHAAYAAAGRMAERAGDRHSQLLSRIGQGMLLKHTGNLAASEKALRAALQDAQAVGDRDAEARASHDLADTLHHMGRQFEAARLAFRAFQLYEQVSHKARALGDLAVIFKDLRRLDAAKDALAIVLKSNPGQPLRANSLLEMLDIASLERDRVGFERWRREVDQLVPSLTPLLETDFALKLGIGLQRLGEAEKARMFLEQARVLAETHALNQASFEAEAALSAAQPSLTPEQPVPIADDAELIGVEERLRELSVR